MENTKPEKTKTTNKKLKTRGKKWQKASAEIQKEKLYSFGEAIELLKKIAYTKFDPTVEVHIKTASKKKEPIRGLVSLPHQSGKMPRVAIFSETILEEIKKGKLNFDILLARPSDMPQLAKVAKILGPKGLMPNPKSHTLTEQPEKEKEKIQSGQIEYRADPQGNIHQAIGKLSWETKKLEENYQVFLAAVKQFSPVSVSVCASMTPAIKLQI